MQLKNRWDSEHLTEEEIGRERNWFLRIEGAEFGLKRICHCFGDGDDDERKCRTKEQLKKALQTGLNFSLLLPLQLLETVWAVFPFQHWQVQTGRFCPAAAAVLNNSWISASFSSAVVAAAAFAPLNGVNRLSGNTLGEGEESESESERSKTDERRKCSQISPNWERNRTWAVCKVKVCRGHTQTHFGEKWDHLPAAGGVEAIPGKVEARSGKHVLTLGVWTCCALC